MRTVAERFTKIADLLVDERIHLPFTVVHAHRVDWQRLTRDPRGELKFTAGDTAGTFGQQILSTLRVSTTHDG